MAAKTIDSRSIRRLGARIWRDGHQAIEFFIPEDLPREKLIAIGSRLPFLRHRNRAIKIYFIADQKSLDGTLIVAGYRRDRNGSYIKVYESKTRVPRT